MPSFNDHVSKANINAILLQFARFRVISSILSEKSIY